MAVTITHVNTTPGPGNKVSAANWTAGHVITGGLQSVTVTVPSADILTLNTTPYELLAAPGSGKAIALHRIVAWTTSVTAAYTLLDWVHVRVGPANCGDVAGALQGPQDTMLSIASPAMNAFSEDVVNQGLNLYAGDGDPTDGDGDLTLTVYYTVEDVPA